MAIARRSALDSSTRQKLVDAALGEFAERGYHGASLNHILEESSVSKGQFYYHYRSKTGLLRALIGDLLVDVRESIGPLGPPPDSAEEFWTQLEDGYQRVVEYFVRHPTQAGLAMLLTQVYDRPEFAHELDDFREEGEAFLRKKAEEGRRLGAVRTDVPAPLLIAAAGAVLEATDVWMAREYPAAPPQDLLKICRTVFVLLRRMIAPDGMDTRRAGGRAPRGTRK